MYFHHAVGFIINFTSALHRSKYFCFQATIRTLQKK